MRQHVEALVKSGIPEAQAMAQSGVDGPLEESLNPDYVGNVWEIFWRLQPIELDQLLAYCQLKRIDLEGWEVDALIAMERAFKREIDRYQQSLTRKAGRQQKPSSNPARAGKRTTSIPLPQAERPRTTGDAT